MLIRNMKRHTMEGIKMQRTTDYKTDISNINGRKMTRKPKVGRKNNCMDISSNKQAKSRKHENS